MLTSPNSSISSLRTAIDNLYEQTQGKENGKLNGTFKSVEESLKTAKQAFPTLEKFVEMQSMLTVLGEQLTPETLANSESDFSPFLVEIREHLSVIESEISTIAKKTIPSISTPAVRTTSTAIAASSGIASAKSALPKKVHKTVNINEELLAWHATWASFGSHYTAGTLEKMAEEISKLPDIPRKSFFQIYAVLLYHNNQKMLALSTIIHGMKGPSKKTVIDYLGQDTSEFLVIHKKLDDAIVKIGLFITNQLKERQQKSNFSMNSFFAIIHKQWEFINERFQKLTSPKLTANAASTSTRQAHLKEKDDNKSLSLTSVVAFDAAFEKKLDEHLSSYLSITEFLEKPAIYIRLLSKCLETFDFYDQKTSSESVVRDIMQNVASSQTLKKSSSTSSIQQLISRIQKHQEFWKTLNKAFKDNQANTIHQLLSSSGKFETAEFFVFWSVINWLRFDLDKLELNKVASALSFGQQFDLRAPFYKFVTQKKSFSPICIQACERMVVLQENLDELLLSISQKANMSNAMPHEYLLEFLKQQRETIQIEIKNLIKAYNTTPAVSLSTTASTAANADHHLKEKASTASSSNSIQGKVATTAAASEIEPISVKMQENLTTYLSLINQLDSLESKIFFLAMLEKWLAIFS